MCWPSIFNKVFFLETRGIVGVFENKKEKETKERKKTKHTKTRDGNSPSPAECDVRGPTTLLWWILPDTSRHCRNAMISFVFYYIECKKVTTISYVITN